MAKCYFRKLKSGKRIRVCPKKSGLSGLSGGKGSGRKKGSKNKSSGECRKIKTGKQSYVCVCKGKGGGFKKMSHCGGKKSA